MGIIDTMKDLLVNFVGAVFFSIIGALYARGRDKKSGKIASQFIPKVMDDGISPNEKKLEIIEKDIVQVAASDKKIETEENS